jgi:catechol 2,3-dioxygenase-like lactoylglutathione lyase family enzyme
VGAAASVSAERNFDETRAQLDRLASPHCLASKGDEVINGLSHVNVWVLDQDSAKAFYTEKLGFGLKTDRRTHGGLRWITVHPPEQPELVLVLGEIGPPMIAEPQVSKLRELVAMGTFGIGVLRTDDCRTAYHELSAKGVEFLEEPRQRPYGVEAVLRDDSGNWFALTEAAAS